MNPSQVHSIQSTPMTEHTSAVAVVDVRTPEEFAFGHVPGSLNIPLQELPQRLDAIRALGRPLILCCASGQRSGQAVHYLRSQGIACENGGSWLEVRYNLLNESGGCCG